MWNNFADPFSSLVMQANTTIGIKKGFAAQILEQIFIHDKV